MFSYNENMASLLPAALDLAKIRAIRHDLHAHPQVRYEETYASAVVQRELESAGIAFKAGLAGGTGVLGFLPATQPNPTTKTIALRADMDALPIHEETGKPYASQFPGCMHACGHDGHTSILIGTAHALAALADRPSHVLFVFQPAEEGGAGAKRMMDDGALDGSLLGYPADMMFGLHGWTTVALGRVETLEGPMMAATDEFFVHIHGQGGHAAAPETTIDPVVIASHLVLALQSIASRNTSPFDSIVVTVGELHTGTANNIIPMSATLHGTIRTMRPEIRQMALDNLRTISHGVCSAFGARAEVDHQPGYPVTSNHAEAVAEFMAVAEDVVGQGNFSDQAVPTMGGEDFSFYGEACPTCFFQLGLIPTGESTYPSVHTPHFDFNDDALEIGIRMFVELATR